MSVKKWVSGSSAQDPNGTSGADIAAGFNELVNQTIGGSEQSQASVDKLNYYLSAGQSLSIGYTDLANAPVNTGNLESVYLYNGVPAIAPPSGNLITPSDVASLVPFSQPSRETHIYSMLETLMGYVGGKWLVAPCGEGGQSIARLTKGNVPYKNGLVMRDGAEAAATSLTLSGVNMPFSTWIQGESDVANDVDWYQRELYAYVAYLNEDMASLSGNSSVPVYTTQIGTSGSVEFAAGELDSANAHPSIYCAGPNWPIARLYPSSTTDYTHLNAEGYILLGKMLAAAINEVSYKGFTSYKPTQPKSVKVRGSSIEIEFHVPKGQLVVDTTTFQEAPMLGVRFGYGVTYGRTTGTYKVIGNKLILDYNMDKQPIIAGTKLTGGNTLTDHSATNGISVPLINLRGSESNIDGWYDWCCQFSIEITEEMGAINKDTDNVWTYGTPYIDTTSTFVTVAGTSSCYFLDGLTYQVDYDSADIVSGGCRIWVGDTPHDVVAGGASLVMPRGNTTRLRIQSLGAGFTGRINNLRIVKAS